MEWGRREERGRRRHTQNGKWWNELWELENMYPWIVLLFFNSWCSELCKQGVVGESLIQYTHTHSYTHTYTRIDTFPGCLVGSLLV